jgi:hypothetical protein
MFKVSLLATSQLSVFTSRGDVGPMSQGDRKATRFYWPLVALFTPNFDCGTDIIMSFVSANQQAGFM